MSSESTTASASNDCPIYVPSKEGADEIEKIPRRITRGANGIVKRNLRYAQSVSACQVFVPKLARLALSKLEWKEAMASEFEALKKNESQVLIPGSNNDNVINNKWIFKVKQLEIRSVDIYKA